MTVVDYKIVRVKASSPDFEVNDALTEKAAVGWWVVSLCYCNWTSCYVFVLKRDGERELAGKPSENS